MDNLSETAKRAREAGLSYGKFVALEYEKRKNDPLVKAIENLRAERKCKVCGKQFPYKYRKIYCSEECKEMADSIKKRERYRKRNFKVD